MNSWISSGNMSAVGCSLAIFRTVSVSCDKTDRMLSMFSWKYCDMNFISNSSNPENRTPSWRFYNQWSLKWNYGEKEIRPMLRYLHSVSCTALHLYAGHTWGEDSEVRGKFYSTPTRWLRWCQCGCWGEASAIDTDCGAWSRTRQGQTTPRVRGTQPRLLVGTAGWCHLQRELLLCGSI